MAPNEPFVERRKDRRESGPFPADLLTLGDNPAIPESEDLIHGAGLDISNSGMRVMIPLDVAVGARLVFLAIYRHRQYVCMGKVVWKQPGESTIYGLDHHGWSPPQPVASEAGQTEPIAEGKNL